MSRYSTEDLEHYDKLVNLVQSGDDRNVQLAFQLGMNNPVFVDRASVIPYFDSINRGYRFIDKVTDTLVLHQMFRSMGSVGVYKNLLHEMTSNGVIDTGNVVDFRLAYDIHSLWIHCFSDAQPIIVPSSIWSLSFHCNNSAMTNYITKQLLSATHTNIDCVEGDFSYLDLSCSEKVALHICNGGHCSNKFSLSKMTFHKSATVEIDKSFGIDFIKTEIKRYIIEDLGLPIPKCPYTYLNADYVVLRMDIVNIVIDLV